MPKIRVKTGKQHPKGPVFRRCTACGNRVNAGDKFCIKCGMPVTTAAPAVGPQKQRPKSKPAAPRAKKRKPVIVPVLSTQPQKQASIIVPALSTQEKSVEAVPETVYCGGCGRAFPHGRYVGCLDCGIKWWQCYHHEEKIFPDSKIGTYHNPWKCAGFPNRKFKFPIFFTTWHVVANTDVDAARKDARRYRRFDGDAPRLESKDKKFAGRGEWPPD